MPGFKPVRELALQDRRASTSTLGSRQGHLPLFGRRDRPNRMMDIFPASTESYGSQDIVVNGRFLSQPVTGVQRYATEVTRRLEGRIRFAKPGIAARGFVGHAWEQLILPRHLTPGDLLWSPANTGPLRVLSQVVTIHDLSVIDHPEWFGRRFAAWYRWLLPRLARTVRLILTDSEFSRSRLLSQFDLPKTRVVVVPPGVDERFGLARLGRVEAVRKKYSLPHAYFLAGGSLEPRKNLRTAFQAWEQVSANHPACRFLVFGAPGGSFRSRGFERIPDGVILQGYVDDEDLPALYAAAVGFIYVSLYEGFGLPVLEAMASGTPVICSSTTSIPEVAGDASLLVNPLDPQAIADAMERLLTDRSLQADLRERGLRRAATFSWERTAAETWKALQGAMKRGNGEARP